MEATNHMTDKNADADASLYKEVIQESDRSGELKTQVTIDLTAYNTSEMKGFKEGDKVYKGYTCKIATLKPAKEHPRGRIDINPANKELRDAILGMYTAFDKLIAKRL